MFENVDLVEIQKTKEIQLGRYVVCENVPSLVSVLGIIPKNGTSIRLIQDLSRPQGGLNKLAKDSSVQYQTLRDATKHMTKVTYIATIDLKEAYRSIPMRKSCFQYTGLQWHFSSISNQMSWLTLISLLEEVLVVKHVNHQLTL